MDLELFPLDSENNGGFKDPAAIENKRLPIHRWVTWIAGFSASFAGDTIQKYLKTPKPDTLVLDPFAGVGTTLVEAYRRRINTIGFEINPFAALVGRTKLRAVDLNLKAFKAAIHDYVEFMAPRESAVDRGHTEPSSETNAVPKPLSQRPQHFRSRIPFFSPPVEQKVLWTLDFTNSIKDELIQQCFKVALGAILVSVSNYSYEPSLTSRPASRKPLVLNAPVAARMASKLLEIAQDVEWLQQQFEDKSKLPTAELFEADFFRSLEYISENSVDLVITSPPYLNNYHYVRNTRPQLFWLGLVNDTLSLSALERASYGKFWQTVRDSAPVQLNFNLDEAKTIVEEIRHKNREKGAYGGLGWSNYVATYLNDTYRFLGLLYKLLKKSGIAVIVIGNSIVQGVEIDVPRMFGEIGILQGLELVNISIIRQKRVGTSIINTGTREKTTKRCTLYDAAVVLRKS